MNFTTIINNWSHISNIVVYYTAILLRNSLNQTLRNLKKSPYYVNFLQIHYHVNSKIISAWSAGQKTVGINQENNGQRHLGQQRGDRPTAQILWQLTSIKFQLNAGTPECIFIQTTLKKTQHKAQRKSFVRKKLGCKSKDESLYLGTFLFQNS